MKSKTILLTLGTVLAVAGSLFGAPEILLDENGEKGPGNWKTFTVTDKDKFSGHSAFVQKGRTVVYKQRFKMDPRSEYVLSCALKAGGGTKGSYFIGFGCLDGRGQAIPSQSVFWIPGTETVLARAAYVGDQDLLVKNGASWKPLRYGMVAFNIDPQGKQKDLPNRNLSGFGIEKVEKAGENWKVVLKKPLARDYALGTHVREHQMWSARNFVWSQSALPKEWRKVTGRCSGVAVHGNARPGQWWPGTDFFEVVFMLNPADGKPMLFDDIRLEKIPAPAK